MKQCMIIVSIFSYINNRAKKVLKTFASTLISASKIKLSSKYMNNTDYVLSLIHLFSITSQILKIIFSCPLQVNMPPLK